MKSFFIKNKKIFCILSVFVGIYFLFFHNLWAYKLLDVDETRYVDMARKMFADKEFFTLYLNGDYFFEKPPLYFWLESISFAIFRHVSEFTARIPIALQAICTVFAVYLAGTKIVSKKFGIMSALILATTLEFIIFAKISMLDMLLTSCITISIFSGFYTFFAKDKNKKYFWWLFYLFSGLAVMAKGIPGVAVPFGVMFFAGIYSKKFKEYFKPQYLLVGFGIFLLTVLPWHILMCKIHNPLFWNEYIMKHHFARFTGSDVINRERPFYYYMIVIIWGFFPWIFSFVSMFADKWKKLKYISYNTLDNEGKFVALCTIGALFTFLFFTSSGTKLITYILPIYPFVAVILAKYWLEENISKWFRIFAKIFGCLIFIGGVASIFAKLYLPEQVYVDIFDLQIIVALIFMVSGVLAVKFVNNKTSLFITYVVYMIALSGFFAPKAFSIDYKFGENDLIKYAQMAKAENMDIVTYGMGRRYCLLYYSNDRKIISIKDKDIDTLYKYLKDKKSIVVMKNNDFEYLNKYVKYDVMERGRKFSVITEQGYYD